MNNIDNIVSAINDNGGEATLDDILTTYVRKWHILPVPENKLKIKSTLVLFDGKKVFFNKETGLWSTERSSLNNSSRSNSGNAIIEQCS